MGLAHLKQCGSAVIYPQPVTTQQTRAAGELLVQYRLLKVGIDSARLTTDAGIDLVVYAPGNAAAMTVQVKTNFLPGPLAERER